jgi:hypothetical protein
MAASFYDPVLFSNRPTLYGWIPDEPDANAICSFRDNTGRFLSVSGSLSFVGQDVPVSGRVYVTRGGLATFLYGDIGDYARGYHFHQVHLVPDPLADELEARFG